MNKIIYKKYIVLYNRMGVYLKTIDFIKINSIYSLQNLK